MNAAPETAPADQPRRRPAARNGRAWLPVAPRPEAHRCQPNSGRRSYLRALRAAEMAAWEEPGRATARATALAAPPVRPSPATRREATVLKLLVAAAGLMLLQTLAEHALLASLLDWLGAGLH